MKGLEWASYLAKDFDSETNFVKAGCFGGYCLLFDPDFGAMEMVRVFELCYF